MKKILLLALTITTTLFISACSTEAFEQLKALSSEESLASLSYLSAGLLDSKTEEPVVFNSMRLSTINTMDEETTEIETELDDVNIYVDKLKAFIDNGPDQFGQILVQASDRAEYANMQLVTVGEDEYILYYNVDVLTQEITGLFVIGSVEYEITASNSLIDSDQLGEENEHEDESDDLDTEEDETDEFDTEDESDDLDTEEDELDDLDNEEDDEDDDEFEQKMVLVATNGDDTITITYKLETEEDETTQKFEIEKNINGLESSLEIKISIEEDEYKLTIKEDGNEYSFKRELEDDGEVVYKLKYEVNGVKGEVKITETVNDLGETVYTYKIKENNKESEVEIDEPDSDGFDGDHESEDEEENEV